MYSGIYEIGFEKNDFFPDDCRERWSLEGSIDDLRRRMTGPGRFNEPALGNRVYVVVEGNLSKPGHYGHNGGYRRELSVTRVIEARNAYSHLR